MSCSWEKASEEGLSIYTNGWMEKLVRAKLVRFRPLQRFCILAVLHISGYLTPTNYIFLERSWIMLILGGFRFLPQPLGGGGGQKNVIFKIGKSPKLKIVFCPPPPPSGWGKNLNPPRDQHYPRPFQKYIVCGGQIPANMQNRQYAKPLEGPKTYQFCPHQFFHPSICVYREAFFRCLLPRTRPETIPEIYSLWGSTTRQYAKPFEGAENVPILPSPIFQSICVYTQVYGTFKIF